MSDTINIAAYKFITIDDLPELHLQLKTLSETLALRGTILLAPEGINLFLAGPREAIDAFLEKLRSDARFSDLAVKESLSEKQPFRRLNVKIKKEIITMRMPAIEPEKGRAATVDAHTLKRWLDQGHDDHGRPVTLLDTRNAFEVDIGSFDNAVDYRISKFSEFPDKIAEHQSDLAEHTVVSFCTGGIRCEKAALHMKSIGLEHVYQLDGGILKYFEEVGGAHYHGECFVFDYRTALDPNLQPTNTEQCFACRAVLTPELQNTPEYIPGQCCPNCYHIFTQKKSRANQAAHS